MWEVSERERALHHGVNACAQVECLFLKSLCRESTPKVGSMVGLPTVGRVHRRWGVWLAYLLQREYTGGGEYGWLTYCRESTPNVGSMVGLPTVGRVH